MTEKKQTSPKATRQGSGRRFPLPRFLRDRFGLREHLLAGLALVAAALVLSVGFVALWAVGRQLRLEQRQMAARLADSAVLLVAAELSASNERAAKAKENAAKAKENAKGLQSAALRTSLRRRLEGLGSSAGFVEIAVVDGRGGVFAMGDSRHLKPAAQDRLLRTLPASLSKAPQVRRRNAEHPRGEGVDLVFYRRLEGENGRWALRLTYSADRAVETLMRRARWAVWALAVTDGLLLLLLAGVFITRAVTRPLEELQKAARRVADGDLAHNVPVGGKGEVKKLGLAFNEMTQKLRQNETTLKTQIETLEQQQRQLQKNQSELAASRQQLIQAEKFASVGRLAAGVAHEVGNPLTALVGYVEMLQAGDLTAQETTEFLELMDAELRRMDKTIRALLDYSRRQREPVTAVALDAVIRRAANLVKPQRRMRDVDIRIRLPDDLMPVAAEENRLSQVFVNLLLNAADAMEGRGEVCIVARVCGPSHLSDDLSEPDAQEAALRVQIDVYDSGPGIPPAVRDKVFDPFFTTKEVGRGTGLGLSICQSILEGMGGTITLLDSPNEWQIRAQTQNGKPPGAAFRIVLKAWSD